MRARHRRTLERLFSRPPQANIRWREVVALMDALEIEVIQRAGSRVLLRSGRLRKVVHQPHPRSELNRTAARDIADFLEKLGITP